MSEFSLARGTGQDQTENSTVQTSRVRRNMRNLMCLKSGVEFYSELGQAGWFGISDRSLDGKGRVN
jgi:hypothetical protein